MMRLLSVCSGALFALLVVAQVSVVQIPLVASTVSPVPDQAWSVARLTAALDAAAAAQPTGWPRISPVATNYADGQSKQFGRRRPPQPVTPATHYVEVDGNASSDCTLADPCTFPRAFELADTATIPCGSVVNVATGYYFQAELVWDSGKGCTGGEFIRFVGQAGAVVTGLETEPSAAGFTLTATRTYTYEIAWDETALYTVGVVAQQGEPSTWASMTVGDLGPPYDITGVLPVEFEVTSPTNYTKRASIAEVELHRCTYWNDTAANKVYVHMCHNAAPAAADDLYFGRARYGQVIVQGDDLRWSNIDSHHTSLELGVGILLEPSAERTWVTESHFRSSSLQLDGTNSIVGDLLVENVLPQGAASDGCYDEDSGTFGALARSCFNANAPSGAMLIGYTGGSGQLVSFLTIRKNWEGVHIRGANTFSDSTVWGHPNHSITWCGTGSIIRRSIFANGQESLHANNCQWDQTLIENNLFLHGVVAHITYGQEEGMPAWTPTTSWTFRRNILPQFNAEELTLVGLSMSCNVFIEDVNGGGVDVISADVTGYSGTTFNYTSYAAFAAGQPALATNSAGLTIAKWTDGTQFANFVSQENPSFNFNPANEASQSVTMHPSCGVVGPSGETTDAAPQLSIQVPVSSSTYTTSASGLTIGGSVSDDIGIEQVSWVNNQGGSGAAQVTGNSWTVPFTAAATTVFDAPFTYVGNIDVTMGYTPAVGTGFTEFIDTVGTNYYRLYGGGGYLIPYPLSGTIIGQQLALRHVTATSITSGNYYVESTIVTFQGANDHWVLLFGIQNTSNYCLLIARESSNSIDLEVGKVEADVYATIGAGVNAGPVNGQTARVLLDGKSIKAYLDTVEKLSVTDTAGFCDNATGTGVAGLGAGAFGGGTGRLNSVAHDNYKVVDLGGGGNGVTLAAGVVNLITVTARDTADQETVTTLAVTQAAADNIAPVTIIDSPTTAAEHTALSATGHVGGTGTDAIGVVSGTCSCATCTPTSRTLTITNNPNAQTVTWVTSATFTFASGPNLISCTLTDAESNTSIADTYTEHWTPADAINPVVTICPGSLCSDTTDGANFMTATSQVTLAGTCTDNSGQCLSVTITSDNCGPVSVQGTAGWTAQVSGTNVVCVFTVTGRDPSNNPHADTITVTFTGGSALLIQTIAVSNWTNGTSGTRTMTATGGVLPYTWTAVSGGSSLSGYGGVCAAGSATITTSANQGIITMTTPSSNGNCPVQIRVTDSTPGTPLTDDQDIVLTVVASGGATRHSFFNTLAARADCIRAWSLTPGKVNTPTYIPGGCGSPHFNDQLKRASLGGFADAAPCHDGDHFKYLYPSDPFAEGVNIDATKVIVAAWTKATFGCDGTHSLGAAISDSATETRLVLTSPGPSPSLYDKPGGLSILVDNEKMTVVDCIEPGNSAYIVATRELCVSRGAHGSTRAAHSSGALTRLSVNSVPYQMNLPVARPQSGVVGTEDGHVYVFIIDTWWSTRYMNTTARSVISNYKWVNLLINGLGRLYWEIQSDFSGDNGNAPNWVAANFVHTEGSRSNLGDINGAANWSLTDGFVACSLANCPQGGLNGDNPIRPFTNRFNVRPNIWTRHWIIHDQRAADYDRVTKWVADETSPAVKIYDEMRVSVRNKPNGQPGEIDALNLRFNTSVDIYRLTDDELYSYVSGALVLKNVNPSEYATPGSGILIQPVP